MCLCLALHVLSYMLRCLGYLDVQKSVHMFRITKCLEMCLALHVLSSMLRCLEKCLLKARVQLYAQLFSQFRCLAKCLGLHSCAQIYAQMFSKAFRCSQHHVLSQVFQQFIYIAKYLSVCYHYVLKGAQIIYLAFSTRSYYVLDIQLISISTSWCNGMSYPIISRMVYIDSNRGYLCTSIIQTQ